MFLVVLSSKIFTRKTFKRGKNIINFINIKKYINIIKKFLIIFIQ